MSMVLGDSTGPMQKFLGEFWQLVPSWAYLVLGIDLLTLFTIGIVVTYVTTREKVRVRFAPTLVRLMDEFPAVSYAFAFVLFFELATMFDEPRQLAQSLLNAW